MAMTKREQLYYLLKAFMRNEYDVGTFCEAFEDIFYPDIPYEDLTSDELDLFESLAKVIVRFSPFDEDLVAYPRLLW